MKGIELAYLGVEVSDVPGLREIVEGVAGMAPGQDLPGAHTWRNDDRAQRLIATEGSC